MTVDSLPDVHGRRTATWPAIGLSAGVLLVIAAVDTSSYGRFLTHAYEPDSFRANTGAIGLFLVGWALMMVAMMLPAASTLLRCVASLSDDRLRGRHLQWLTAAGFIATWVAVGYVFRVGDVLVHTTVTESGWFASRVFLSGASLLFLAGVFQFSEPKYRGLTATRSPRVFVHRHWRGVHQRREAMRIGMAYGLSCMRCSWALMLVMFALGAADVRWMLALGFVMAIEKNASWGPRLGAPIGIGLVTAAIALVAVGT